MSTNLYLKLPHRLLHQPTWLRMSPRMKALAIQIALVAGDQDCEADGGMLPPLEDLAVLLRADPEELETDLGALEEVGYLSRKDGCYVAAEFMRWQATESAGAKRMRSLRAKQKAARRKAQEEQRHSDATVASLGDDYRTRTRTEPETEPETEKKQQQDVVVASPKTEKAVDGLAELLIAEGVATATANELSRQHDVFAIRNAIAYSRDYVSRNGAKNYPGLIVSALRRGFEIGEPPEPDDICPGCGQIHDYCTCDDEEAIPEPTDDEVPF